MKPGWTEVSLGDVATVDRQSVAAAAIEPGTLYVGLEDIDAGGGAVRPRPVESGELGSNKFVYNSQHILYGKLRPYLAKIVRAPGVGICSTDILPIRANGVDRSYLLHFLRQPAMVDHAAARSSGANLPRLAPKELERFRLPLPPLEEQQRIAAILDKADDLQAKRRAAVTHLDSLTQAIFLDMFGDPLANPLGWPIDGLGDLLVELQYGPRFYDDSYSETGVPIVRITDLNDAGDLDFSAMPRMDLPAKTRSKYVLRHGDLLFARSGATVGKVALVRPSDPECIAGAYFMVLRPKPEVESTYLFSYLRSESVHSTITTRSRQAAQQNFSGPAIRRLPVTVPPRELQVCFRRRVTKVQRALDQHRSGLAQADSLSESLRARAFRGEL